MLLSNLYYIPLRLLRKFALREDFLLRFGAYFPYYRTNLNQSDPKRLVDEYERHLTCTGFSPKGRRLLEIGVGRTNSVGYELAARFEPQMLLAFEPFVEFSSAEDTKFLLRIASQHNCPADRLSNQVSRVRQLDTIKGGSIDLILSGSVLEHVNEPIALFTQLRRILAPAGVMLHLVDYRDHLFKYPYHFLQFRKKTWNRWLNPGDLPVWRLYDHLEQLRAIGFSTRVLEETRDFKAFAVIAAHVSPEYNVDDIRLQTTTAAIWAFIRSA